MGIFDKAKEVLGGEGTADVDESTGQQYAEQVEGLAGPGGPPSEDPLPPGQSPAGAVRPPIAPEARNPAPEATP